MPGSSNTPVAARPLAGGHASREIALAWRESSPREKEFALLGEEMLAAGGDPLLPAG